MANKAIVIIIDIDGPLPEEPTDSGENIMIQALDAIVSDGAAANSCSYEKISNVQLNSVMDHPTVMYELVET